MCLQILRCPDRELNTWSSLKKISQIRSVVLPCTVLSSLLSTPSLRAADSCSHFGPAPGTVPHTIWEHGPSSDLAGFAVILKSLCWMPAGQLSQGCQLTAETALLDTGDDVPFAVDDGCVSISAFWDSSDAFDAQRDRRF